MNIFDKKLNAASKPTLPISPIELYETCPYKENYGYLRGIQEEVLKAWDTQRNQRDIVCKMNTGSGKTLTGLIMLYSKLVEKSEPCIYLVPDKQLLEQTISQASLYGIPVCKFEDEGNTIPSDFINAKGILITTFHKLFNGKSIFEKQKIKIGSILLDDAHKCVDIARENSTIKLPRSHAVAKQLFTLFSDSLKHQLPGTFYRLEDGDPTMLMKVPYWSWMELNEAVIKIINGYVDSIKYDFENSENIKFAWGMMMNNILLYDCYFSGSDLEISPIHVPHHEITSFDDASHRFILSATFEDDFDLIKDLGISWESILNPIIPADRKDVGKRLILAPSRFDPKLNDKVMRRFISKYPSQGYNTVIIVPSITKSKDWQDLGATIVDKNNILESIKLLSESKGNFFVFVNRYDGIDLYNDLCRILVIDGLPQYDSLKEQYEESRLTTLRAGKKAQIIEQGLGRATRSGGDFSVVYMLGNDLVNFLGYEKNLKHFTPLTRAQISMGLELLDDENSDNSEQTISDTALFCLTQDKSWHNFHTQSLIKSEPYVLDEQKKQKIRIASLEKQSLEKFRRRKYVESSSILLDGIIGKTALSEKEEAWYYQFAGQLIYKDNKVEANNLQIKACDITTQMFHPQTSHIYKKMKLKGIQGSNVRKIIESFSLPQDIVLYVEDIISKLQYGPTFKSDQFEASLNRLGEFIGFSSQMPENELGNGPDVLWCMTNGNYLILEAKSMSTHNEITRDNIGQLLSSEEWFKKQYPDKGDQYLAITLQQPNKKGGNVNISSKTRVLDGQAIRILHENLRNFAKALQGKFNNGHTDDQITQLLVAYKLTPELFVQTYLKFVKSQ